MPHSPTNAAIADTLEKIADLLDGQDKNPFRVRAYREGAQTVRNQKESITELIRKDQFDVLKELPHIGDGIAAVIGEYVESGKSGLLTDLESHTEPEKVLSKVPGIGEELAGRITDQLHIRTLPELEEAAHDGRLAEIEGFGSKRVKGVQSALAEILRRTALPQQNRDNEPAAKNGKTEERPSLKLLLEVDADYRKRGAAGDLPKIAPKRFNPDSKAWLPLMHAKHDGWAFTALYSNTAQAHKLEKTDDWVVIYYEKNSKEHQNTVVTETKGALKGKRVVRGRELENRKYYGVKAKT